MIGIDTNLLLRFFVEDDEPQFDQARQFVENNLSRDEPGFVSLIVVVELAWALKQVYKLSHEEIANILRAILEADELRVERASLVSRAVENAVAHNVEFSDALITAGNVEAGCTAFVTFDQSFSGSGEATLRGL